MSHIRISPKHGLNPTIPVCFHCGQQKNEIALLGKLKNDAEASKYTVLDYEPCDACKEQIKSEYVMLTGVTPIQPDARMPITKMDGKEYYPTESIKIRERILGDIFPSEELVSSLKDKRRGFIEDAALQSLKAFFQAAMQEEKE